MAKNQKHTEGKVKSNGAQTRSWPLISQSTDDAQITRGPLGQVTSEHVTDEELPTWVAKQRQLYKDGRLPDAYTKILEAVPGWSWEQNPKIENRSRRGRRIDLAKFDSAEVLRLMDVVSEARRNPFHVIQGAIDYELAFGSRDIPSKEISTKEPPIHFTDLTEEIAIDGALGLYDSRTKKITVFPKGIRRAAKILRASPNDLEQIVLLHEWAHALLHLGLEKAEGTSVLQSDSLWAEHLSRRDSWFNTLDPKLHEALAQLLVREGLRRLKNKATIEDSKAVIDRLQDVFVRLTRRAPCAYQIDKFEMVDKKRVLASIHLLKKGGLVGADAWEKVVRW